MSGNLKGSLSKKAVLLSAALTLCAVTALAGKPSYYDPFTETLQYLGNGYPSGPHFNLNLIGKTPGYDCTTPDPNVYGYGNVIFLPDDGSNVSILMESGSKGPKSNIDTTQLEVTDACAGFAGPNDSAVLRLPANAEGYAVFARTAGKPSDDGTIRIFDPAIAYVAAYDVNTEPLFFLGIVSADGVFTSSQEVFERQTGKRTAREITDLFMWSGMVCYPFGLPEGYTDTSGYDFTTQCCDLIDVDLDGIPDQVGECGLEYQIVNELGLEETVCSTESGWIPCVDFATETWVFNIADIVDYVWNVENNGIKNLKIRFYPLPLDTQPWVQGN